MQHIHTYIHTYIHTHWYAYTHITRTGGYSKLINVQPHTHMQHIHTYILIRICTHNQDWGLLEAHQCDEINQICKSKNMKFSEVAQTQFHVPANFIDRATQRRWMCWICLRVCMSVLVCVYECVGVCGCVWMVRCIVYVCLWVCLGVCMCVGVGGCVYVCGCGWVCVCIHIYSIV